MSTPSSPAWEGELVSRAQGGDEEAFGELVRAHADRAYAIALRMTGDPHDAQDIVQDAMVAAWRHLEAFAGQSSFNTWLTRIVINGCHNHRRAARPTAPLEDVDNNRPGDGSGIGGTWEPGPEQVVLARAQLAAAQTAILALPFDQRAALVLHTVAGCSHAESARVLGISESAARVRVHRARATLVHNLREWR